MPANYREVSSFSHDKYKQKENKNVIKYFVRLFKFRCQLEQNYIDPNFVDRMLFSYVGFMDALQNSQP